MRKKFLKILALSSLMLTAGGVMAISQLNNRNDIHMAEAYSTGLSVSADGFKKTMDSSYAASNSSDTYIAADGVFIKAKSGKTFSSGKLTNLTALFFEIPDANASGNISITCGGSNTSRFTYYTDGNGAALTSGVKFAYSGAGKVVTNAFSRSDLVTIPGYEGKYFIGLSSNGTDYKFKTIDVVLDNGVSSNFNGPLKQKFSVSYYDRNEDGTTSEYTSIKVGEILEGDATTKPTYIPTKVGYEFANWVTEDGTVYDFATPVTSNLSLYASWTKISTFTVTFDYGFGENSVVDVNPNTTVSEPEELPHPEGKTFIEWQLGGIKYDFATPVTGDITLVAKWVDPIYSESVTIDQVGFTWTNPTEGKKLSAKIDDKNGKVNTHPEVTWTSSNENVVTVDKDGNLTAVNKGEATITATIYAGDVEHEKSSSIKVIVPLANLSTAVNEDLYYDFAAKSKVELPDDNTKESAIVDLDRQTFGGFTLISLANGNDTKWSGAVNNNGRGRSLMTNADFVFTAKRAGTLTVEWTSTSTSARYITINGVDYKITSANSYVTTTIELNAGKYTIEAAGTGSDSDHKIWYKTMRFSEKVETNWVDTTVHLGYQVGKMNESSATNDSVKFVGFIDKEAFTYLKDTWFEITINDGAAKETARKTTVYTSIGYYDETGKVNEFAPNPEMGATADFYYFAFTLTNIPSTFKGTISAKAYVEDANGIQYVSAASAEAKF